jgi:hypothetical protein
MPSNKSDAISDRCLPNGGILIPGRLFSVKVRDSIHFSLASDLFSRLHSRADIGWNKHERKYRIMATGTKRKNEGAGIGVTEAPRADRPVGSEADRFLEDDEALLALEEEHPEGLTAAQIVEAFTTSGVRLSEATFRKWVQLGLLPRSRRVGRKGKHQGSLGIYPPSTVRRIAAIKRLMAEGLTVEDIARSLRFKDEIEQLERGLNDLFRGFEQHVAASGAAAEEQQAIGRLLDQVRKQAGELVRRIGILERRIVAPLEREAKARAFGTGTAGGAADLL